MSDREFRFEQMMSDAEAMMWNIEKDPRLSSSFGTVTIVDRPIDIDVMRKRIGRAVADIPRMRERVAPVFGRLSPPLWEPDPEFELDYHVRQLALAPPGDERQLFELCTRLLQDPLDRTRPLWMFVAIDGLPDGRGALFTKLHHTITDGEGGVRLAEMYMDVERDPPPPPAVDLDEVLHDAERERVREPGDSMASSLGNTIGHGLRRGIGIARRTAGEAALAFTDPARLLEGTGNLIAGAASARDQLSDGGPGSPVWTERSRHRWFDVLDVPFTAAKEAAVNLGGSLNDFFVTGAAVGAVRYHDAVGAEADHFNATFVMSTRTDGSAGGNAFTPSKVRLPASKMDVKERLTAVQQAMTSRRSEARGANLMGAVSGLANLLPTSFVTGIARSQAASVDFATSNVRAAPFELYIAGAKVLAPYPMGPVAGTAWNITMLSYAGALYMGVHVDPAAVEQPDLLMRCLRDGFREVLEAGGTA